MKTSIRTTLALIATSAGAIAQSAADGEKVFRECAACHQVGEGATNRTGSVLTDVIGRAAGSVADFKYSSSMPEADTKGLVWADDLIFDDLADSTAFLCGHLHDDIARAKMTFRLKPAEDLLDYAEFDRCGWGSHNS
ncbi:MAG: hypothetical protein WBN04_17840 [Paracoccaceae bacterium]